MVIDKPQTDRLDVRVRLGYGDGDTIASVGTITVPGGLTLDAHENTADELVLWFSGGVLGAVYDCSAVLNTTIGRITTAKFRVRITA